MDSQARAQYEPIIITLFRSLLEKYGATVDTLPFTLRDVRAVASALNMEIGNLPDIAYSYRTGRQVLPSEILAEGQWAIVGVGKGKYAFQRLLRSPYIDIPKDLAITPILDATPLIVLKYQQSDEQALLARIRYNRLVDIFTGLTAYQLQGHYRTTVAGLGQVEIDELYIGLDTDGVGFVLPIEAKSKGESLGVVQISQMVRFAQQHLPDMLVRPIGVSIQPDGSMIFVEFNTAIDPNLVATLRYKRYLLTQA